jgi:hypothetical protein
LTKRAGLVVVDHSKLRQRASKKWLCFAHMLLRVTIFQSSSICRLRVLSCPATGNAAGVGAVQSRRATGNGMGSKRKTGVEQMSPALLPLPDSINDERSSGVGRKTGREQLHSTTDIVVREESQANDWTGRVLETM